VRSSRRLSKATGGSGDRQSCGNGGHSHETLERHDFSPNACAAQWLQDKPKTKWLSGLFHINIFSSKLKYLSRTCARPWKELLLSMAAAA
jgi:hypothetical protein